MMLQVSGFPSIVMATIKRFEDIEAWKIARERYKASLRWTQHPVLKHRYRFIDQVTSSIGCMMDNSAEDFERGSTKEFVQFLGYANGPNAEFRSQLYQARDVGTLSDTEFEGMNGQALFVAGKIRNLMKYLRATELKGARYLQSVPESGEPPSGMSEQNLPPASMSD